ncbi:hypothetical protein SGFS_081450 [Streptomyces graminofaciens]|uniref:Uncharacterized protein n=1 Tax=Streptomyces graminofaciens TaxID=68212 RepID=A0ABM7FJH8_9ACTN|nr:hypothetical protein SGFS_081450 [Streptomyces graminofaciens]
MLPKSIRCRLDRARARKASGGQRPEQEAERGPEHEAERGPEHGPALSGFTMLPWLLMGLGSFANLFQGETPNPWIGGIGLFTFNSLYISVVFRSFVKEKRESPATWIALALMTLDTCALAIVYGGSWLNFFPLLGLAVGAAMRGRMLRGAGFALTALAGTVSAVRDGWDAINVAYGTFLSVMVTAAILSLAEAVRELRAAREELARRAVAKERLRFSRDLHDLLGHTLSVIVVKSEAARRLAPHDPDTALAQIADIESVGRQALTEIREAVTGYREGSLTTELDRAHSALSAAGTTLDVRRSGPPLAPPAETLLAWVVREAVTNVVRHSRATHCTVALSSTSERAHLTITDDGSGSLPGSGSLSGSGSGSGCHDTCGTGLKGLSERLATAGGTLRAGPGPRGGFVVTAELPVEPREWAEGQDVTVSAGRARTPRQAEPGQVAPRTR